MSEVCFIQTCFFINEGSAEEKRSLVAKFMPDAKEELLDMMKHCSLAKREVDFYKYAFSSEFQMFCENSGLHHPVPDVYWAGLKDKKITIVLHDLCSDGLKLSVVPEGNSLEQIKCALATVAVIHGAGIATIKKHGTHPGDIPLNPSIFKDYVTHGINKQIELFEGTSTVNTLKALLSRETELLSMKKYPLVDTFLHGDFWAGNIMFSQGNRKACIFDWQFAYVGNPVCDILTFIFISGEVSCFTEHLTEILECYWESFEQSLKKNGITVDISFQDLVCSIEAMWMYGYAFFSGSLPDLLGHNITEDRVRSIVQFLEKKGMFKKFLS